MGAMFHLTIGQHIGCVATPWWTMKVDYYPGFQTIYWQFSAHNGVHCAPGAIIGKGCCENWESKR